MDVAHGDPFGVGELCGRVSRGWRSKTRFTPG
jgi:hypothetical protein